MKRKFFELVKELRLKSGIGLRRFAELVEVAPSNWSAIESGRRKLPTDRVRDVAEALGLVEGSKDWVTFFDAATEDGEFPVDVSHLAKRKLVPALLRTIDNHNLSDDEIRQLIEGIQSEKG